ncbi:MAG: hypothetical protein AAF939_07395 [Planctomycetota bacterium]
MSTLPGYSVECVLKALILNSTPTKDQEDVEAEFRGQRAHCFEWLRLRYYRTGAPQLPVDVSASLTFVSSWETSIRYKAGMGVPDDSARFLTDVQKIVEWADNRI